jgi:hypothetical protein
VSNIWIYSTKKSTTCMHKKKDIIALGGGVLTTRPPGGLSSNQVQAALPMVCGWRLCAWFGCRRAIGDGRDQSRRPPWCAGNEFRVLTHSTVIKIRASQKPQLTPPKNSENGRTATVQPPPPWLYLQLHIVMAISLRLTPSRHPSIYLQKTR